MAKSRYIGIMTFDKKESFTELTEENFTALAIAIKKDEKGHRRDVMYAQKAIQSRIEIMFKESNGIIDWESEIKRVNKVYFMMRPVGVFDRAVMAGENKGFFKQFLGMNKARVLQDYRMTFLYLMSMELMLIQKAYYLKKYMKENNLPLPLKIPTDKIPSEYFFKSQGINYWGAICMEAINETSRRIIVTRRGCQEEIKLNNVVQYVNNDGELLYSLDGPMMIKPGSKDKITALRER